MFKYTKIILIVMALILALSMFGCSKDTEVSSDSSSKDISVDIVDVSQVETEPPSYFKNLEELAEAKAEDEDGLFERFENIPIVYINSEEYSLTQIGFYPEYNQVALRYGEGKKIISLIASKDAMPVETDAEVAKTMTVCEETVDLYQIGLEEYWGCFDKGDLHLYLKFPMTEDIEQLEELLVQSTIAELLEARAE